MTGKLPDPRALAKFLRTIAASPVQVKSFSLAKDGAVTVEFGDGPARPGQVTHYSGVPDKAFTDKPSPEEEREAWDMVRDSVVPGMLGEAN